jgi:phosphoribosyl-ATP pyrophosphohydrolase
MLTEETQDVIFFMESVTSEQATRANQAMQELKRRDRGLFWC